MKTFFDEDLTTLEVVQNIALAYHSLDNNTLSQYTKSMNVEVPISHEDTLLAIDPKQMNALSQCLLTMYAAKYFAAVNLKLNITNMDVIKVLNTFSTNKDLVIGAVNSPWLGVESIALGVSTLTKYSTGHISQRIGLEAPGPVKPKRFVMSPNVTHNTKIKGNNTTNIDQSDKSTKTTTNNSTTVNTKATEMTLRALTEVGALAVGKTIVININTKEGVVPLPINIKLLPSILSKEDFLLIGKVNSQNKTLRGRLYDIKSGRIRPILDGLLCMDLLAADKKALIADKSGTMLEERRKFNKGIISAVISGEISPNSVSRIIVISSQTAKELEYTIGGQLSKPATRDRYFKSNYTASLVVVDMVMERFTIYEKDINDFSTWTFDDIKSYKDKNNTANLEDAFKAAKLGMKTIL